MKTFCFMKMGLTISQKVIGVSGGFDHGLMSSLLWLSWLISSLSR